MLNTKLTILVRKIKQGNEKAFDEFYELTKKAIYFNVRNFVKNPQSIEDLMQDTYMAFMKNIDKIEEQSNIYSWLITVARNKAINYSLKNKRSSTFSDLELVEGGEDYLNKLQTQSDLNTGFDAKLESNLSSGIFFASDSYWSMARELLDDEEFEILTLRLIYGYKQIEIAKLKNKSVSTLNWQYNKIIKSLKQILLKGGSYAEKAY